ncbi:MAG: hypothetical protein OXF79_27455 [Chloroflexi bacterium]|nr:hypothetical protein [Chloroflexota bacterium]
MTTSTFKRGLNEEFVNRLNEMHRDGGWWPTMVEDKRLPITIRDNYINVYYQGCSVLKLSWSQGKIAREIHYKYLLKPSIDGSEYIGFGESGPKLPTDLKNIFLEDLDNVGELKRAVTPYAGLEKKGVHDVVVGGKNPNVVDLEVAIGEGKSVPRMDLAAFARDNDRSGTVRLVFYEAKHFQNPELRSRTDTIPVVDQMDRYSKLIHGNRDALLESYREVCRNLSELEGVGQQNSERHTILRDIATGSVELLIDDQPRLIVFGFDRDQRDGNIWGRNKARLTDKLSEDRTLFVGNARNVRLDRR